ncbi:MAG: leucine-rich repeat domain-containing protein, partial [Candidatus Thorarchaeota archaeon]|nr:leucine-rich repeat domain-containing protein [Candidatus Thorarchaeota archaeon]
MSRATIMYTTHSGEALKTELDTGLMTLDFNQLTISSIDLSEVHRFEDLRELSLSNNYITSLDLTPLRACRRLESVDLSANALSEARLEPICECPR